MLEIGPQLADTLRWASFWLVIAVALWTGMRRG